MVLSLTPADGTGSAGRIGRAGRTLVIAGLVLVALSACGRRGALQAPPDPAVAKTPVAKTAAAKTAEARTAAARTQTQQPQTAQAAAADEDDEEADVTALPSPAPTPAPTSRGKAGRRGYTIPKEPFILDPLL